MVRDVHEVNSIAHCDLIQPPPAVRLNWDLPYKSHRRGRANLTHGVERSNGYRMPTAYHAWDIKIDVESRLTQDIGGNYHLGRWCPDIGAVQMYRMTSDGQPSHPLLGALKADAQYSAREAIDRRDIHYGEFFGELPETVRFVADSSGAILRFLLSCENGIFAKAWKELKALYNLARVKIAKGELIALWHAFREGTASAARAWLTFSFVLRPLISDIKTIVEKWEGYDRHMLSVHRTRTLSTPSGVPTSRLVYWEGQDKLFASTKYQYAIVEPRLRALADLGIANPFETLWELVPMSFVVDWFVPIGSWLSSWNSFLGCDFYGGYTTFGFRTDAKMRYATSWMGLPWTNLSGSNWPETRFRVKTFGREIHFTPPYPRLYLRFYWGGGITRAITALSLARTRFG